MPPAKPTSNAPPACRKVRLRFRKTGDLRLVSHHDLMHCFERLLRRARIPIAQTRGFHPQPRMIFALSLALGVTGSHEVVELELTEDLPDDDVLARLRAQAPPGLDFLSIRRIDLRQSAQVRRACYRLPLPTPPPPDLPQRCAALLEQKHCWFQRRLPRPRRLDLRVFLSELQIIGDSLDMALWISPYGAARPEEIAGALGLTSLLDSGAVLERKHLELIDETPEGKLGIPEIPRDASANDSPSTVEETAADDPALEAPPPDIPAAPRPTSLIGSPLSFDT